MQDAWARGARSLLFVLPTGGGKTSCFAWLASERARAGERTVVLVHRRELATQAANRFREFGVDFGYVMAGEHPRPGARVQIASVQTLVRRQVPPASLVICDEAHLSTATTWQKILEQYPHAKILGCSATPWRLSGKPLVGAYDASIVAATPDELRRAGFLCSYTGFSFKAPDLDGVKKTGGDYNEQQSSHAMMKSAIVDNVVEMWQAHASHLSTVVFAVTVEHSKALCAKFKAAGVTAEHVDGATPIDTRRMILKRVESGATKVLCNVGIAVEGLDVPRLKCCVLARPTLSVSRYLQMVGRVRRPWNGFQARIHDHSFCLTRHGLPDADRDFTLNAKPESPPSLSTCSECLALFHGRECPACGKEQEAVASVERVINTIEDAEQYEFTSEESAVFEPEKPPIEVKWNQPGRVIEGRLLKRWDEPTEYGTQRRYLIEGDKRKYQLPGTKKLDALLSRVQDGTLTRTTYIGPQPLDGGREFKDFKVEVDQ